MKTLNKILDAAVDFLGKEIAVLWVLVGILLLAGWICAVWHGGFIGIWAAICAVILGYLSGLAHQ